MKMNNFKFKKENKQKGFTLIEMLVSVALFSIVVMISLGAILTILDANRKARTLTEVMSNLNFAVEMITRSLKTGVEPQNGQVDGGWVSVDSIVLSEDDAGTERFKRQKTRYKKMEDSGRGYIAVCSDFDFEDNGCPSKDWSAITSEMIDVQQFETIVVGGGKNNDNTQPRVHIFLKGTVKINAKISSDFSLQTTVSQRRLNLVGSEADTE